MMIGAGCFVNFFYLVTTVVFPVVVRPFSLLSVAGTAVSASVLDDVEKAVAGSSTIVEGRDSASESISVVTRSVVRLVLDVEASAAVVSSSTDPVPSVVASVSLLVDVDALVFEEEQLNATSSSPEPVDICVGTTANVVEDDGTAGPVDVAIQTERWLCFLNECMDHVKLYFPLRSMKTDALISAIVSPLGVLEIFFAANVTLH